MYDNSHKFTASQHYFSGHSVLNLVFSCVKMGDDFFEDVGEDLDDFFEDNLG